MRALRCRSTGARDEVRAVTESSAGLAPPRSVRLNRAGVVFGIGYLILGVAWIAGTDPGPAYLLAGWFVIVAVVGAFIPGVANQVSLARAHLAAPALVYSLAPDRLGFLAVVLALAGLTDLVDGTIARRFDKPSMLGGGLDPVVDGVLLGAVAVGLAVGGIFPLWLAARDRGALPAARGGRAGAAHCGAPA